MFRAVLKGSYNAEVPSLYSAECSKQRDSLTSADISGGCDSHSNWSFADPFAGPCSEFKYSTFGRSTLNAFHSTFLVLWDCQICILLENCI